MKRRKTDALDASNRVQILYRSSARIIAMQARRLQRNEGAVYARDNVARALLSAAHEAMQWRHDTHAFPEYLAAQRVAGQYIANAAIKAMSDADDDAVIEFFAMQGQALAMLAERMLNDDAANG